MSNNLKNSVHQPFSWLRDDVQTSPLTDFVETTLDISLGLETCLNLAFSSELERSDPEGRPTLNLAETHNVLRLAIAANKLLHMEASSKIQWLNKYRRTKGAES